MVMGEELLSTGDLVAIFNVTRATVADWANSGKIPSIKTLGGHSRFLPEDIRQFLRINNHPFPAQLRESTPFILAVDDEPSFLKILSRRIRRRYPTVELDTADNGVSALLTIGRRIPDIIILDLLMPRMDGIEVIRRLKADPAFSPLRILAVSGFINDEKAVLQAGADAFFPKGSAMNALLDAIAHHLPREKLPRDMGVGR